MRSSVDFPQSLRPLSLTSVSSESLEQLGGDPAGPFSDSCRLSPYIEVFLDQLRVGGHTCKQVFSVRSQRQAQHAVRLEKAFSGSSRV